MKKETVTYYVATDGKRLDTEAECLQYEADGCVKLKPIPNYGDHRPLTQQHLNWMMDGDGDCYYATIDRRSSIRPGPRGSEHPAWATHLIYFGK